MARVKKAMAEEVVIKEPHKSPYTCLFCSSELKKEQVYTSRNKLLDKQFTLCKGCACREANSSLEDFHAVLMLLDIPFLPEVYKTCEGEGNMFSAYILRINNPRKKYEDGRSYMDLRYSDSPTLQIVSDVDAYLYHSDEELSDLQSLFGDWWTREQLTAMNKELDKMFIQYGGNRDNFPMVELYSEIITLKWHSRTEFAKGNSKEGKALSEQKQKLLKDNGMNVQAMRDKKDNDSIGERIDWVEYEPILPSKKYYDIDGIMFMWEKLMEQLLRFVGANKKPVEEDAKEMIAYVENHEDYCQDME